MVITENHDDYENYRCDNDIVKASEDSSHDDDGKQFSDDTCNNSQDHDSNFTSNDNDFKWK